MTPNSERKEQHLKRMSRHLNKLTIENNKKDANELPFPECYSFRLLGIILDCQWIFEEQIMEVKKKQKGD